MEKSPIIKGLKKIRYGISVCLYKAEIIALLGPNGSGKTTTVKLRPGSGHRIIDLFRYSQTINRPG